MSLTWKEDELDTNTSACMEMGIRGFDPHFTPVVADGHLPRWEPTYWSAKTPSHATHVVIAHPMAIATIPAEPRTLADIEPYQCYRDSDGEIVWHDSRDAYIRWYDGRIYSGGGKLHEYTIIGPCLGHVSDVLRLETETATPADDAEPMTLDELAQHGLYIAPASTTRPGGFHIWTREAGICQTCYGFDEARAAATEIVKGRVANAAAELKAARKVRRR